MKKPKQLLMRLKPASEALGCSVQVLRIWLDSGKVKGTRTPGGQRRVYLSEVRRLAGSAVDEDAHEQEVADTLDDPNAQRVRIEIDTFGPDFDFLGD